MSSDAQQAPQSGASTGPKALDELGARADESRFVVDVLCRRVLRPDFQTGEISGRVSADELAAHYASLEGFVRRMVTEAEWQDASQKLNAWQDELEARDDGCTLARILAKHPKFPPVTKVKTLLGEEIAESYSEALENIELSSEAYALFPSTRVCGGWTKHSIDRAVSLVVDVISPHSGDPRAMASAYGRYMDQLRSQTKGRGPANCDRAARRKAARSLGIWLPLQVDLKKWESDPRSSSRAPDFERLVNRVVSKMRTLRSVLQYVPRRRFSNHTIADMDANMARIRDYLKENVDRPAPEGGAPPRKRARPADQKDTIADGEKEEEEEQREEEEEKEDEDDSFSLDEKDSDPSEDERRCDSAASMNS